MPFFFLFSFSLCHRSDAKPRVRGMKATRVIQCHGSEHPAALWVQQTAASLSLSGALLRRGVLRGRHSLLMTLLPLPRPPYVTVKTSSGTATSCFDCLTFRSGQTSSSNRDGIKILHFIVPFRCTHNNKHPLTSLLDALCLIQTLLIKVFCYQS